MSLTHISLFAGIGGIDLAAEAAGFETIAQVERDNYCRRVLARHWPSVPRFDDVRDVTARSLRDAGIGRPTLLSGGFPCQPVSKAGKRRGAEDDRFLWPEMCRIVSELRPAWVLGENVTGLIDMELDNCLSDLEGEGYACRTFVLPAAGVGAPHLRERCFLLAHAEDDRHHGGPTERRDGTDRPERRTMGAEPRGCRTTPPIADVLLAGEHPFTGPVEAGHRGARAVPGREVRREDAVHADRERCAKLDAPGVAAGAGVTRRRRDEIPDAPDAEHAGGALLGAPGRVGRLSQPVPGNGRGERATQPGLGGIVDGLSARLDRGCWGADWEAGVPRTVAAGQFERCARLRALGNAVVPMQVFPFVQAIADIEMGVSRAQ